MPCCRTVGKVPSSRDARFRWSGGDLFAEELAGPAHSAADLALLYHRYPPGEVVAVRPMSEPPVRLLGNGPPLPRHLRTHKLDGWADAAAPTPNGRDAAVRTAAGRVVLLANADVRICYMTADRPSPLYRDTVGDECGYVESGYGILESALGRIPVGPGDFVVVPTSTVHRWIPAPDGPLRILVLEAAGQIGPPAQHVAANGQFLGNAPYRDQDLRAPGEPLLVDGSDVDVLTRQWTGLVRYTYAHHPFDVVGWSGCRYPWVLNIADTRTPLVPRCPGGLPQPPAPVQQTVVGPNFLVCSLVPAPRGERPPRHRHPVWPFPGHRSATASDDVFFCGDVGAGTPPSEAGLERGSMWLHPSGFAAGPQPGSVQRTADASPPDGTAVMVVSAARRLRLTEAAIACEDANCLWGLTGLSGRSGLAGLAGVDAPVG